MLGYVMVGTTNLQHSIEFYDALLARLGLMRDVNDDGFVGYSAKQLPEVPEFYVTEPINNEPATFGNGSMFALVAGSRKLVDVFHATGLKIGGADEGKPGLRPADGTIYYAYIRDPDGNKICAYCDKAE